MTGYAFVRASSATNVIRRVEVDTCRKAWEALMDDVEVEQLAAIGGHMTAQNVALVAEYKRVVEEALSHTWDVAGGVTVDRGDLPGERYMVVSSSE